MNHNYAKLINKKVVFCNTMAEALPPHELLEKERRVAETFMGDVRVSTVFLFINHACYGQRDLWFETMIFGGKHDGYQERYETWDEAVTGHNEAVDLVKGSE